MSGWYQQPIKYAPEVLAEMQRLWEQEPDVSSAQIGARLGVSKNVVIGQANRRGWVRRRDERPPSTLLQRLDTMHKSMDRLLIGTRPFVEDRPKTYIDALTFKRNGMTSFRVHPINPRAVTAWRLR